MGEGNNDTLWVNTSFRGRQLEEFLLVKERLGITTNVDVVRYLVRQKATEILQERSRAANAAQSPPEQ